jgi:hypothetical protein
MRPRASLFGGATYCGYPIVYARATVVCSDPEERIIQDLASELRRFPLPHTPVNRGWLVACAGMQYTVTS